LQSKIKQGKKKENEKLANIARMEAQKRKKREAQEKRARHLQMMEEHAIKRREKMALKKARGLEHDSTSRALQEAAINIRRCEVELSFDASSLEETLREMLSKHGEIESMKKNIKGGLDIRYTTASAAKSLLRSKRNNKIQAQVVFPVTPVVIKQHCVYYKPESWIIDQEVLNATAEFFSSIFAVQQVKKSRNAVLIVLEDRETRDQMVKQGKTRKWRILGRLLPPCNPGLPPAINKRKAKQQPRKSKKGKNKVNGNCA